MIYLILKIGLQRYSFQFKNQNWGEKDLSVRGLKENNCQYALFNAQCLREYLDFNIKHC